MTNLINDAWHANGVLSMNTRHDHKRCGCRWTIMARWYCGSLPFFHWVEQTIRTADNYL